MRWLIRSVDAEVLGGVHTFRQTFTSQRGKWGVPVLRCSRFGLAKPVRRCPVTVAYTNNMRSPVVQFLFERGWVFDRGFQEIPDVFVEILRTQCLRGKFLEKCDILLVSISTRLANTPESESGG